MVDIFERLEKNAGGPIGMYMGYAHGYFAFPKLEGEIGPHMTFRGQKMLNWSLNNYLGLANHPEVREADAKGAAEFGMAAPMGARMMSGQTKYHEQLERELAEFVGKPDAFLLNFGYQGMISIIDCLLTPRDVVVYDARHTPASSTACACTRASVSYMAITTWRRCACNSSTLRNWRSSRTAAYSSSPKAYSA